MGNSLIKFFQYQGQGHEGGSLKHYFELFVVNNFAIKTAEIYVYVVQYLIICMSRFFCFVGERYVNRYIFIFFAA